MPSPQYLTRQEIARIAQNDPRMIKALENLLNTVIAIAPSSTSISIDDLASMIGGGERVNTSRLESRISDLETAINARRKIPDDAILKRMESLELSINQRANYSSIERRITQLEQLVKV